MLTLVLAELAHSSHVPVDASCLFCPDDDEEPRTPASEFGDDAGTVDFTSYVNQVSTCSVIAPSFVLTVSPFADTFNGVTKATSRNRDGPLQEDGVRPTSQLLSSSLRHSTVPE